MPIPLLSNLKTRIDRISLKVKLLIIVSAALLIAVFSVAMIEVTGQNFFCASCHEMNEYVATWKNTSHQDVSCKKCHIPSSGVELVKSKIGALKEVYYHLTADMDFDEIREGSNHHIPNERCQKCHKETEDLIIYHDLKITHKDHWELGIDCTDCHARVVHGPRAKNTPTMATCRKCHDGETASEACSTCHVTLGEKKPSTFEPEWVEAHKVDIQQNKDTCQKCHNNTNFCNSCHTTAKPHKGDWFGVHADEAQKDMDKCSVCHKERYCTDCHATKRQHALDWIPEHGEKAKTDREDCSKCHKESFCTDCHTKLVKHPDDWLENHGSKAEDDPERCENCHSLETFCMDCHG